jgi:hypothetical protein
MRNDRERAAAGDFLSDGHWRFPAACAGPTQRQRG